MMKSEASARMAVVPTIPYRNTAAMIDWLSDAFGFRKRYVAKGESGEIKHARLTFGDSTIMVFPVQDLASEKLVVHPDQVGGVETQTCYLVVNDVDAHYANAKAKGAEIIFGIRTGTYGGRGYVSRDPEGHVWMFGTYDPQQGQSQNTKSPGRRGPSARAYLLILALSALTVSSASAAYWAYNAMQGTMLGFSGIRGEPGSNEAHTTAQLVLERNARQAAEQDIKTLSAKLAQVQNAKEAAEHAVADLMAKLTNRSTAQETAEQAGKEARQLLVRADRDREALVGAVKQAEDRAEQARVAKEAAEKAAKDAFDQLAQLRLAKLAAERLAKDGAHACEQEKARLVKDTQDRLANERSARAAAELASNELRHQLAAVGSDPVYRINELRTQIEAKQRAQDRMENELKDAKLLLAQEKYARDSSERALKLAEKKLASAGSCWACPTGAPCERPE